MKRKFLNYVIFWIMFVLMFNVIVFATPNKVMEYSKFGTGFWVGYLFIMISFLGQLAVAFYALKDNISKVFLRIPLLRISYIGLVGILIIGLLCMIIPNIPVWLGVILCMLCLCINVIVLMQAHVGEEIIEGIDKKNKVKTFFIKSLVNDLNSLRMNASNSEMIDEISKVYEVARYSDPMSDEMLNELESQIMIKMEDLSGFINDSDVDNLRVCAKELIVLIKKRNNMCKLLK